jgi:O-acetyl-ADP-ribose deacetylase (regulator of RNase III)
LALAREKGVRSIAFPAISTGVYGYPKREAAGIALQAMRAARGDFEQIIACCFGAEDAALYLALCPDCDGAA